MDRHVGADDTGTCRRCHRPHLHRYHRLAKKPGHPIRLRLRHCSRTMCRRMRRALAMIAKEPCTNALVF
ncbi:hypothetical protein BC940DRAFT_291286 [Gongronella butleri]|nr:hypothetical protein BC940DRAFT_291286 [Gongronella butleri]